jgi:predicted RNase H-like HicB family nuclease
MKQFTIYQDEDGRWVVTCSKVPGLAVKAKTQAEAVEKMKKALTIYFPCGECGETS